MWSQDAWIAAERRRHGIVRVRPSPPSQRTYLIGAEDGDKVKIGRVGNPQKRVCDLQIGNADTLVVLALVDTPEALLHQRFAHLRVRGEWFHRDAELNAFIAEHAHNPHYQRSRT